LAVALNALTFCLRVGELGGSTGSTQGRTSQRFRCGRGVPSNKPRASQNMVEAFRAWFWLVLPSWAEPLAWFSQGFVIFSR
jgi:hypothetical protein